MILEGRQKIFVLDIISKNPEKKLDPDLIENLAAEGKTRAEIAKIVKCSYSVLCAKLRGYVSLNEAFQRGQSRYVASLIESGEISLDSRRAN